MPASKSAFALLAALSNVVVAEFGLAGQLFQLEGASSVNNAKLAWATVNGASAYRVEQSTGGGVYQTLGTVPSNTYDSYGLTMGSTYSFRVTALNGNSVVDSSNMVQLSPWVPQGSYNTYDNTQPSSLRLKSDLFANGLYYRYNYETFSNGSFSRFVEQTSTDGYTFSGDKTVLVGQVLCKPASYSCKLERVQFRQHPGTGEFVMWAHYERSQDYGLGWVAVAHKAPSDNSLTFDGAYRPNGEDSRDMAFFNDGVNAWLVTSTNTNTDNNIYSLTEDWHAVDQFLIQVNKGGHREAPAVVKANDWYYLYTSRAAGWLPSQPQYMAAQSMAGPWSSPVNIGNTATFCAQSGGVNPLSSGQFAMTADRWSSNWPSRGGPTRQLLLPISFSSEGGFSAYHFYSTVSYSDDIPTPNRGIYGIQSGRIISVGKPSTSNAGTQDIAYANDGISTNPDATYIPSTVPFTYTIDLQSPFLITQIDLTTKMVQGSETFYKYTISASVDGETFTTIADRSNAIDVGFSTSFPDSATRFRYVRVNVQSVVNNVNGNEADWARGINEVTVYGV